MKRPVRDFLVTILGAVAMAAGVSAAWPAPKCEPLPALPGEASQVKASRVDVVSADGQAKMVLYVRDGHAKVDLNHNGVVRSINLSKLADRYGGLIED